MPVNFLKELLNEVVVYGDCDEARLAWIVWFLVEGA